VHSFKQASKEQLTPAAIAPGVTIELAPDRIKTAEIASKRRCIEILPEMRVCPDNQHRERTKFDGHAEALTIVTIIPRQLRPPGSEQGRSMVASDSFAEFLREQFAPLGRVSMRRMFGKTGVFCDGLMFAMVTDDTLYFRVDDQNREAFEEAAAFPSSNYAKGGRTIDLAFWRAPERLWDEPDELVAWARTALAAARRVAAKRG
jgi:DNA transformation protein